MAKKLEGDFPASDMGRPNIYPWDEWMDGSIWRLERGEDFQPEMQNFRTMLYHAAKLRGKRVRTRVDGTSMTIQAVER